MRAHDDASSSSLGSFTPRGFGSRARCPDSLYAIRAKFLAEANIPELERRRLARIAESGPTAATCSHTCPCALGTGDGIVTVFSALRSEIRRDRRLVLDPMTGRFVVGQLGGRRIRAGVQRALAEARRRHTSNLS